MLWASLVVMLAHACMCHKTVYVLCNVVTIRYYIRFWSILFNNLINSKRFHGICKTLQNLSLNPRLTYSLVSIEQIMQ